MAKPKNLFRAMSAKEVDALWTKLMNEYDDAAATYDRCLTSDKQGVMFLWRDKAIEMWHKMEYMKHARHILVDILAKGK